MLMCTPMLMTPLLHSIHSGLIGNNVGDTVTIALETVGDGLMYVGVLHSYDRVGWMRATLVVPSTGTIKCTGGIPTTEPEASQVQSYLSAPRDLMWKPKVSERDAIVYMWRFPRIARGRCGWLKIDIAEDPKKNAKAGRSENKVKLLDVIVF